MRRDTRTAGPASQTHTAASDTMRASTPWRGRRPGIACGLPLSSCHCAERRVHHDMPPNVDLRTCSGPDSLCRLGAQSKSHGAGMWGCGLWGPLATTGDSTAHASGVVMRFLWPWVTDSSTVGFIKPSAVVSVSVALASFHCANGNHKCQGPAGRAGKEDGDLCFRRAKGSPEGPWSISPTL